MKKSSSFRFSDEALKHIKSAGERGEDGANAYLERLVKEDMNRWEAEALLALSVKDIGDGQAAQLEIFRDFEARFVSDLSELLGMIKSQQDAIESHQETIANIFGVLEDLALTSDANNTMLEKIIASLQPAQR